MDIHEYLSPTLILEIYSDMNSMGEWLSLCGCIPFTVGTNQKPRGLNTAIAKTLLSSLGHLSLSASAMYLKNVSAR